MALNPCSDVPLFDDWPGDCPFIETLQFDILALEKDKNNTHWVWNYSKPSHAFESSDEYHEAQAKTESSARRAVINSAAAKLYRMIDRIKNLRKSNLSTGNIPEEFEENEPFHELTLEVLESAAKELSWTAEKLNGYRIYLELLMLIDTGDGARMRRNQM